MINSNEGQILSQKAKQQNLSPLLDQQEIALTAINTEPYHPSRSYMNLKVFLFPPPQPSMRTRSLFFDRQSFFVEDHPQARGVGSL